MHVALFVQLTKAPSAFGHVGVRGPAPVVVNSESCFETRARYQATSSLRRGPSSSVSSLELSHHEFAGILQLKVAANEGALVVFGLVGVRGPAPAVVNRKDGRGPATVLAATSTPQRGLSQLSSWPVSPTPDSRSNTS